MSVNLPLPLDDAPEEFGPEQIGSGKRVVRNGAPTNDLVLSAHVDGNESVFPKILGLYVKPGSIGWPMLPMARACSGGTCSRAAIVSWLRTFRMVWTAAISPTTMGEIDCVVLDPPYMHSPGGTAHLAQEFPFERYYANNGSGGQTGSKYHQAVLDLYRDAGKEAYRVLRERGVFIVKCQDEVCANRQRFTHVEIMLAYEEIGFVRLEDLFVVVRNNRPGVSRTSQTGPRTEEPFLFPSLLEAGKWREYMGTPGMSTNGPDPIDLMVQVIREHSPVSIWTGSSAGRLPPPRKHQPRANWRGFHTPVPGKGQYPHWQCPGLSRNSDRPSDSRKPV